MPTQVPSLGTPSWGYLFSPQPLIVYRNLFFILILQSLNVARKLPDWIAVIFFEVNFSDTWPDSKLVFCCSLNLISLNSKRLVDFWRTYAQFLVWCSFAFPWLSDSVFDFLVAIPSFFLSSYMIRFDWVVPFYRRAFTPFDSISSFIFIFLIFSGHFVPSVFSQLSCISLIRPPAFSWIRSFCFVNSFIFLLSVVGVKVGTDFYSAGVLCSRLDVSIFLSICMY